MVGSKLLLFVTTGCVGFARLDGLHSPRRHSHAASNIGVTYKLLAAMELLRDT